MQHAKAHAQAGYDRERAAVVRHQLGCPQQEGEFDRPGEDSLLHVRMKCVAQIREGPRWRAVSFTTA